MIQFSHTKKSDRSGRTFPVLPSHIFRVDSVRFDDDHLVSCAGLLPIMALADQTGLTGLLVDKVSIVTSKVESGRRIWH